MSAPSLPPSILPTSALAVGLEAFVAVRAAVRANVADQRATFELTFGSLGDDHGFMVFAGLEPLLDALERFRTKPDELIWLESVGAIDAPTRERTQRRAFMCDVDAAPEGSVVFPGEAVLTVEGPFWQAQLVSALVTSALGDATLSATRVARCALAAEGTAVIESTAVNARRLGGAPLLARAAYIGGAHATTSALAGKRYGVPVRAGTADFEHRGGRRGRRMARGVATRADRAARSGRSVWLARSSRRRGEARARRHLVRTAPSVSPSRARTPWSSHATWSSRSKKRACGSRPSSSWKSKRSRRS
jgi:hypothetical protein